jgi:hypothetical protein
MPSERYRAQQRHRKRGAQNNASTVRCHSPGGANSISSVPLPCNVRANFDLEGEQVRGSREGRLGVTTSRSRVAMAGPLCGHSGRNERVLKGRIASIQAT